MEQNIKQRKRKKNKKYKKRNILIFALTLLIIISSIFSYFLFKKNIKNPKIIESIYLRKINTEYDNKKINNKGQKSELDLLAKYTLMNLFTLKGSNDSNLQRLNELVDNNYQNEFDKQIKQNILFKKDFFKDSYNENNFPDVKNVLLKSKEKVEDVNLNNKQMSQYKLQCVLEYDENTLNKTSNDILLQKNFLQTWPYELKIYFYWDESKNNWQISKLLDIITIQEKEHKKQTDIKEEKNKNDKKEIDEESQY